MSDTIPADISELLESALEEKIGNFEIKNLGGNAAGQGYLGDMLFITLKNKNTGKERHVVVKQVLSSNLESTRQFMSSSYLNEIYFYTKVIPSFLEFQKSYPKSEIFDNVPKCLATSSIEGREKLVLENLKMDNYEVHPKKIPVTDEMYEEIFKLYGRYHGISFAFKNLRSEKFSELVDSLGNNFKKFMDHGIMMRAIRVTCYILKEHLDAIGEKEISEKFQKYVDNGAQIYVDTISYKSPFSVILHGDCWSNNLMFKYDESGKIIDIKMIDFQMSMCGSPVLDLTYSFYSGAAKESLDKLDHFLRIYYNSLGETLKRYDCEIEKLFSFDDLKKEWKERNAFGFLMGLLLWMDKHVDVSKVPSLSEMMDRGEDAETEKREYNIYNTEGFRRTGTDLIRHMYENDFL